MNTTLKSESVRDGDAQKSGSTLRPRISILAMLILLVALFCSGCEGPAPTIPDQMAAPTKVTLVAGDVVKLTFPGAPDVTITGIRTDGKLTCL
jgi:hypothetical protein